MSRYRDWLWGGLVLGMVVAASGCGSDQKVANDLKRLGIAYHGYCDALVKGPAGPKDLEPYYERDAKLTQALDSGRYVFLWNVGLRELGPGFPGATVLAYEGNVPTRGGLVLMGDGSVRHMTAQDFAKAPKATPPAKKD